MHHSKPVFVCVCVCVSMCVCFQEFECDSKHHKGKYVETYKFSWYLQKHSKKFSTQFLKDIVERMVFWWSPGLGTFSQANEDLTPI